MFTSRILSHELTWIGLGLIALALAAPAAAAQAVFPQDSGGKAEWIGYEALRARAEAGATARTDKLVLPAPAYLRTTFEVKKPILRATLYSTSLGIHDLHLNGLWQSDEFFDPGWTDYTK